MSRWMGRAVLALVVSVGLVLVIGQDAWSCGLTTHIEVAERAVFATNETLAKIAREHRGALHAGAVFPDIFYFPCGGSADLSEDLHWTPFLETAIQYIRTKYGDDSSKWTRPAKELVAFLMGASSHMVADVLWHNLGIDQGFIQSMANANFHTSYSPAHTVADSLDDSLILYEMNPDLRKKGRINPWVIPMQDILEILAVFKPETSVPQSKFLECISLQFAVRVLESLVLAGVFKLDISGTDISFAAVASHFLTSNFYDFHVGGFSSMAEASTHIWSDLNLMLVQGSSSCSMVRNPLFISCATSGGNSILASKFKVAKIQRRRVCMHRYNQLMKEWMNIASLSELVSAQVSSDGRLTLTTPKRIQSLLDTGVTFDLRANPSLLFSFQQPQHAAMLPSVVNLRASQARAKAVATQVASRLCLDVQIKSITVKGKRQYDECGASAALGSFDGRKKHDDLAVGCPGGDAVVLTIRTPNKKNQKITLSGPTPFERFGSSLAVVDLNKDGYLDLAVGAPLSQYGGSVYVYLGSAKGLAKTANFVLVGRLEAEPSWSVEGITGFGYGLVSSDMDGDGYLDLVVSAPYSSMRGEQSGGVFAFFASKNLPLGGIHAAVDVAGWSSFGTMPYSWLGKSIRVAELSSSRKLLLVAAPYTRQCEVSCENFAQNDLQSVGAIHGFVFEMGSQNGSSSFAIFGSVQDEKIEITDVGNIGNGSNLVLAIAADTYTVSAGCRQCGRVTLINLDSVLDRGILKTNQLNPVRIFQGRQSAARFGSSVRFIGSDLFVTSPFYGTGMLKEKQIPLITRLRYKKGLWRRHETELAMPGRLSDLIGVDPDSALALLPHSSLDRFNQGLVLQLSLAKLKWRLKET